MNDKLIPSLPRVSREQFDLMSDSDKRIYLLQLKQEDTMKWQKHSSQIQVYTFYIVGFLTLLVSLILL